MEPPSCPPAFVKAGGHQVKRLLLRITEASAADHLLVHLYFLPDTSVTDCVRMLEHIVGCADRMVPSCICLVYLFTL